MPDDLPPIVFNSNIINKSNDPNLVIPLKRIKKGSEDKYYKYLGIHIDEHLTFEYHIDHICNKLSRALYCLNRVKRVLDTKALISIYYSLFHSHLLYCCNIISCVSKTNLKRITILQKKAVRAITNSEYNSHTAHLFLKCKIMPFENLLIMQRALFMHSIYHNYQHISFNTMFTKNQIRDHDHTLRNLNNFYLPQPHTDAFKRSPSYLLPKTWNELPDETKCLSNRYTFKIALKNNIFGQLETDSQVLE